MLRTAKQRTLFETTSPFPGGFAYRPDFLTPDEEEEIVGYIEDLPLENGRLGEYTAKRRVMGFGWGYDFREEKLVPGPPLPPFLKPLQRKIAKWLDIQADRVVEALITEYPRGAAIGWHRDNEKFESIVGISLSGWCTFRLRPLRRSRYVRRDPKDVIAFPVEPRSAYLMQGSSRWDFQHSVPKVDTLRYSITFRTLPKAYPLPATKPRS